MSQPDTICPATVFMSNKYTLKTVEEYITQVESLTGVTPSTEDATEELENLVGFFKVLTDWDQRDKEKISPDSNNGICDQTPNAGGNGS